MRNTVVIMDFLGLGSKGSLSATKKDLRSSHHPDLPPFIACHPPSHHLLLYELHCIAQGV
jgi:hypothetical protein